MINNRTKELSHAKIIIRLSSFDKLIAEDKTNLTRVDRGILNYEALFKISLEDLIIEQAALLGRKINILDAGCGKGVALNELLSNARLSYSLATCTGISLHYFNNIKAIREKHQERFTYYKGSVQDVLLKEKPQFDIIIDNWGAFAYSEDKIQLLQLYHQALAPGGIAEIYSPPRSSIIIKEQDTSMDLNDLCEKYPHVLTYHSHLNYAFITINKSTHDFILPKYKIETYNEISTLDPRDTSRSMEQLRRGNALCPTDIVYVPDISPDQKPTMKLG